MGADKDYFYGRTEPVVPPINYQPLWLDVLIRCGCVLTVLAIIGGVIASRA